MPCAARAKRCPTRNCEAQCEVRAIIRCCAPYSISSLGLCGINRGALSGLVSLMQESSCMQQWRFYSSLVKNDIPAREQDCRIQHHHTDRPDAHHDLPQGIDPDSAPRTQHRWISCGLGTVSGSMPDGLPKQQPECCCAHQYCSARLTVARGSCAPQFRRR